MTAQVVDEFLVLEKYRVMVLDQDIPGGRWAHYQINGEVFDPVRIHVQTQADSIPLNYIAVKGTDSFKGSTVEFI